MVLPVKRKAKKAMTKTMKAAQLLTAALLTALLALALTAAPAGAKTATIKMKGKTDRNVKFTGPDTIEAGDKLAIKNLTDPRKVGPHTFTLLEKKLVPKSNEDAEQCFGPGGVCQDIFVAHEVNEEDETIGKPDIDVGKKGWDVPFTLDETGDSWFTFAEGEKTDRKVKAKAGTKLSYFCVIHPLMAGQIKVK